MSQSQPKKKSSTPADKTQQSTADRRQLVSTRTSPLIRVRFRNPIRTGCGSASTAGVGKEAKLATTSTSAASAQGGCEGRRRRSADSASVSAEKEAGETGTAATTDDMGLEPRTRQYQKHELLQDRSPESGLSEVEAFLLEKQRLMELAKCPENADNKDNNDDNDDKDKLVPREAHYVPHPILQVKTETGLTELELYLKQKEAQLEEGANNAADQKPASDATCS